MSEIRTHTGGCHCGKVRYEATVALDTLMSCNCSMCGKTGALMAFASAPPFKLLSGEGALSDYQFGKARIHHLFCRTCGVRSFATGPMPDGSIAYSINVRCLDGVDPDAFPVKKVDGKSF